MTSTATWEAGRGLRLDARRALWLATQKALVVADLHLGFVWAQRQSGQLLPLDVPDDTVPRLQALVEFYQPQKLVLLGDIVHRATDLPELRRELQRFSDALKPVSEVHWVAGNHDRALEAVLRRAGIECPLEDQVEVGPYLLLHGDSERGAQEWLRKRGNLVIIGHEHPSICLGDDVTATAKCPCFLVGPRMVILPAFSSWAAGVSIHQAGFMSGLARGEVFERAVAVLGERLLAIPVRIKGREAASSRRSPSAASRTWEAHPRSGDSTRPG